MKKLCISLCFVSVYFFSFVCLFFLNISRDQIWMFISKNFKDWYTHHNNSFFPELSLPETDGRGKLDSCRMFSQRKAIAFSDSWANVNFWLTRHIFHLGKKKKQGKKSYLEETQLLRLSCKIKTLKLLSRILKSPPEFDSPTWSLPRDIF